MRYRGKGNRHTNELRRLFSIKLYKGDPDAKKPKYTYETMIAWNAVDVCRACGNRAVAEPPKELHYVTREDDEDALFYRIDDVGVGPVGDAVKPTLGVAR